MARLRSLAAVALLWLGACAQSITSPDGPEDARPLRADADAALPDGGGASDLGASPDGGDPDALPGEPDAACTAACGARRCGPDPVCGASCGSCGMGEACSTQGECIPSCEPGTATCGGDGVSYQGCGFDELLGVPGLGPRIACGAGAACQDGRCSGGSCVPGQVMLVIDRSASIAANNTWAWVRDELVAMVGSYQNDTAIGLRQFPDAACTPGAVVAPARSARVAIERALLPPGADASSPLADSLAGLAARFSGLDDGRAVILLTDGDETCRTAADATRAASVLLRAGVRTYPLALGTANRTLLDAIAAAGGTGTARAVTDAASLRAALAEIMGAVNSCRNAHAQVSLGWYHSCGIRADGQLACWGRDQDARDRPPAGRFVDLAASTDASCAVAIDGRLRCWGRDLYGQLAAPSGSFVEVAGGNAHFCARRVDGTLACWGDDRDRQSSPPAGSFKQVTASAFGSCAIALDDTMQCWGQQVPLSGTFRQIDGGSFNLCGVHLDGTVECVGVSGTPPSGAFASVSTGYETACGLRPDATIECWGSDIYGLITDAPMGRHADVDVSYQTGCAVRESDDQFVCWAYDDEGMASPP